MTKDYFTMDDLERAIRNYYSGRVGLKLEPNEKENLLEKINSINNELVVQEITPKKVRTKGKFTDKFYNSERSSLRLPMHLVKENHVYYPSIFEDTVVVGVEVIVPINTIRENIRGVICYLTKKKDKDKGQLSISPITDNGWSGYTSDEKSGVYVLKLVNRGFINWQGVPWGDLK